MDLLKKDMPDVLAAFLNRGEISITAATRPSWLLSRFEDARWKIKIAGESYFANEKWERVLIVNWALKLPQGVLTDSNWANLLTHAKLFAIASLEAPSSISTTARSLESFCSTLMALCEHLAVHYPDQAADLGLSLISVSEAERFCADYSVLGIPGTGAWLHRLRNFFRSLLGLQDIEFQFGKYITNPILTDAIFPSNDFLIVGLNSDEIQKLTLQLQELDWFNQSGAISLAKIADAIRVDFARIGRIRRRMGYFLAVLEQRRCDCLKTTNSTRRARVGVRQKVAQSQAQEGTRPMSQRRIYEQMRELPNLGKFIPQLKDSVLADSDFLVLNSRLHGGAIGRTPTLPVPSALFIYDRMLHWVLKYTKPLFTYIYLLLEQCRCMPAARYGVNQKRVFESTPLPKCLRDLKIDRFGFAANSKSDHRHFWSDSDLNQESEYQGMGLMDAMLLNFSALVGLTAAFTMRRIGEIVRIDVFSLHETNGRCYLEVECEKKGGDGANPRIRRPIPRILYEGLNDQLQFTLRLKELDKINQLNFDHRLWKLVKNQCGVSEFYYSPKAYTINESLDMFCDWIRVPLDKDGARWYLRIHECRRFGALSFFHLSGQENSLPTLSWFLGHSDISHTWRYIKEELGGKETSDIEAAMAKQAIMAHQANDANKSIEKLRAVIKKYFNAERLDLIDSEDIDEFLKLKHKEGFYKVFPRSIRTIDGQQTMIIVELAR